MKMEQWWNDTHRGKLKFWEKTLSQSQFQFVNQKSNTDCSLMVTVPHLWKVSVKEWNRVARHTECSKVYTKSHAQFVRQLIRPLATLINTNTDFFAVKVS
jgi:hypothetical protein